MTDPKKRAGRALLDRPPRPEHETAPMMVNDISHLFFGRVRAMEPEGVMSQHSARVILRILARQDGAKQRELAAAAHMSAPTVSTTLRRMESEGLIVRKTDAADGRAVGVYLTEKGRGVDRAAREMLHRMDEVLMQGFSPEETECLCAMLTRMRDNILQDSVGAEKEGEDA